MQCISLEKGMVAACRLKSIQDKGAERNGPLFFTELRGASLLPRLVLFVKVFDSKRHSFSRNVKYVSKGMGNYLRMCHANFSSLPKHMPLIENFYVLLSIKISDLKAFQRNLILLQNIMNVDHATKW